MRGAVLAGRVGGATLTQLFLDVLAAAQGGQVLSWLGEGTLPPITAARNIKVRIVRTMAHPILTLTLT